MMKKRISIAVMLVCALAFPVLAVAQQEAEPRALTYELAREAVDVAEAEARRNDWDVTIVVTDTDGVPVYVRRLDGASPRSYEVAMRKSASVVASGLTTAIYG